MNAINDIRVQNAAQATASFIDTRFGFAKVAETACVILSEFDFNCAPFSETNRLSHGVNLISNLCTTTIFSDYSAGNWMKVAEQFNEIVIVDFTSSVLLVASLGVKEAAQFAAAIGAQTALSVGIIIIEATDLYNVYQSGKLEGNLLQIAGSTAEIFVCVIVLGSAAVAPQFVFTASIMSAGCSLVQNWLNHYDAAYAKLNKGT